MEQAAAALVLINCPCYTREAAWEETLQSASEPSNPESVLCFWTLYKLARCVFKKISILPSIGFLHCLYSSGSWEDRNYCSYQRVDGHWNSHSHCWSLAHTSVWPCACSQFTRITDVSLKARPRVKKLLVTYYFFFFNMCNKMIDNVLYKGYNYSYLKQIFNN